MYSNNRSGSAAMRARGFVALWAVLAMGLGLMASPAEAAPFAYVTNTGGCGACADGTVSVIDTATNMVGTTVVVGSFPSAVALTPDGKQAYGANEGSNKGNDVSVIDTATNMWVATVTVGNGPAGVAVTPDGKHAYFTELDSDNVSVIDTATNTVVATVPVGSLPIGVAVTPDGKHAYVANFNSNSVAVIDTATNTVVATIPVGSGPWAVAVTPDGTQAYVTNFGSNTVPSNAVSVIDTSINAVTATILVGSGPTGVAVTPDGKHVYVTGVDSIDTVSVIDTASNTVVATVRVGLSPFGVALTPDGKQAYVTNLSSNTVSVIDTATNKVVATVPAGSVPFAVGIVPPPPGVPFLAFSAKLAIQFGSIPTKDAFGFGSNFILSSTAPGIDPVTEPVTLQVGTFTTTIPPRSFKKQKGGSFTFEGAIHGVGLGALIKRTGTLRYTFEAQARGANLTGTVNTVYATLTIGGDSGVTSVMAEISH
jgi:YVTN family beta-propeller protein